MAGGGIGAVIYNKPEEAECTALAASLVGACGNSTDFPPTVGLARGQGAAVLAMMAAGQEVSGAPCMSIAWRACRRGAPKARPDPP